MNTIYKPDGRALEYSPDALALNVYTGCNHGCTYCYAAKNAKRWNKPFAENIRPREDLLDELKKKLRNRRITGKLIHLCFTCDPYPTDIDTSVTREVISILKNSGNHVQILTKGGYRAERDFDLLDDGDWFGVTYTGVSSTELYAHKTREEPNAAPHAERLATIKRANRKGINTWVSCEPVLNTRDVLSLITDIDYIDLYRIGKLNHAKSDINWAEFGHEAERLCKKYNRNFYIKADLRAEMVSVSI